MNIKSFYVASLSSALDLEIGAPEDILEHTTPDVLADHLPRPLWARLLTACVGAPKVDAQLVIETIGVPNLCEHVPPAIVWSCLSSLAQRSLGGEAVAPAPYVRSETPLRAPLMTPPPPPETVPSAPDRASAVGPNIPSLADVVADAETDDRPASQPSRTRQPTSQRFRQSGGTGIGRLATARRPQAAATTPVATEVPRSRRPSNGEYDVETDVSAAQAREDWKASLAVEDEQLVDWTSSDETVTGSEDLERKR